MNSTVTVSFKDGKREIEVSWKQRANKWPRAVFSDEFLDRYEILETIHGEYLAIEKEEMTK